MNKLFSSSLLLLALSPIALSCSSSSAPTSADSGSVTGQIQLFNLNSQSYFTNFGGTQVVVEGTNFSSTTDDSGRWTLNQVPAGIYDLLVTHPGFDSGIYRHVRLSGDGTYVTDNGVLTAWPHFAPALKTFVVYPGLTPNGEYRISYSGSIPDTINNGSVRLLFERHPGTVDHPQWQSTIYQVNQDHSFMEQDTLLYSYELKSGDSIYALAFGFGDYNSPRFPQTEMERLSDYSLGPPSDTLLAIIP